MPPRFRPARAFTLLELVVVLAVVSMLIVLMIPSLGAARRSGRIAVCSAQLHSIGSALRMYMDNENAGFLPAAPTYYAWDPDRSIACRLLEPYLDKPFGKRADEGRYARNPPYTCPADRLFWFRHGYSYDYFAGEWMTDLATSTIIPRWSRPVTFEYEGGQARLSPVFEDLDFRGHTSGLGPVVGQNRLLIDGSVQWKGWIADSMNEPTVARPLDP